MSFTRKRIDVSLSLANGNFGGGGNSAKITGHRVIALINKPGGPGLAQLECAIYGLPLSLMNQLTTLGKNFFVQAKNTITLSAYEEGSQPSMVYKGTIQVAFADMRAMPEACLRVSATAGSFEAVKPASPTSIQGSADVAKAMGQIAKQAGLEFENNGVNTKVMNPYLWGGATLQIGRLAKAAGIEWIIDNGKLAIWPRDKARQGGGAQISPKTGMVGYPAYTQSGLEVTTLFDPSIQYGQTVTVQSDLKPACGKWIISNLSYNLEAEVPRGKWFCTLTLLQYGDGGGASSAGSSGGGDQQGSDPA
jgi:hypothetical protein